MKSTEDLKNAVALVYQEGGFAPRVSAKGRGLIADQIIDLAKQNGIHIHESRELASLLMQVDLDDHIPPVLYRVVAELLAWLYHIEAEQAAKAELPHIFIPKTEQK